MKVSPNEPSRTDFVRLFPDDVRSCPAKPDRKFTLFLANNMENTVNETQTEHGLTYYEGQLNSYREKLGIGPLQTEQPSPLKSKSAVQEEETEEVSFY